VTFSVPVFRDGGDAGFSKHERFKTRETRLAVFPGTLLRRHFENDVEAAPVDERRVTARLEKSRKIDSPKENSREISRMIARMIVCDKH